MKRTIIHGLIAGLSTSMLVACGGTSSEASASGKLMATATACYAAWNSTTAYNGGAQVSYAGVNYVANWWTQGNNPSTSNGPSGSGQPWTSQGACGSTPTPTPAPTPTPTPAPTPTPTPTSTCTLQAEDYSTAYDTTAGNTGGAYRTGDVDIEATSDTGGGYDVGWTDTGEWLAHNNVTFPTTGSYTFQYRVASPNSTGVISSDLNAGSIQLGTTAIPNTGGWQTWTTVQRTVNVNAGTYNVGTYFSAGGFNLNWIKIVGASCSPAPTPAPTPTPTPTPTGGLVFSAYKDISVNADWNIDQMRTNVTGSTVPVTQAMTGKNTTLTWAFATGECGSENWAGMAADQFASTNVPMFVNSGKKYIVSTGGAAGAFTCGSDSGFTTFLNRYKSANMVGVDFDIETGQTQSVISSLVTRAKNAGIRASFTIATLAQNNGSSSSAVDMGSNSPDSLNSTGAMVINSIKSQGLANYTINLMVMDYGTGTGVCVMSGGSCNMGQSAIQAAMNLHGHYGIPYSHIELTPMNGQNDTANNVFSLSDAATMSSWARSNGVVGVHYWSMDRDPGLSYTNQFISSLGL